MSESDAQRDAGNEEVATDLLKDQLKAALEALPAREAYVLRLRYGLENGHVYTLEEIGQRVGVARERIRQLEIRGLNRLCETIQNAALHNYIFGE